MKKYLFSILTLLSVMSCQEDGILPESVSCDNDLYSSMEPVNATRTSMDNNNNVLWSEGDQLIAFMKTTLGLKYQIKEQYVGTNTGGFSKISEPQNGDDLESGQEMDHNVVLYPYSNTVWCMKNDNNIPTKSYKLNIVLPETQVYAKDSFADDSFPMVAVSTDNHLTFRNICGGIKLQFKGIDKIRSITLESLGEEAISGKATVVCHVDGSAPVITMAATGSKSITLDCEEGVQLDPENPVTFIISAPPVTFASGMKMTVTDTDGLSRTLTNTSSNTILRSSLLTFPVITYSQEGVFELPEGVMASYELQREGGIVEIPVTTNQDYEVIIPEGAGEWISLVGTKALRNETITLDIAANNTPVARSAEVLIATTEGITLQTIDIRQEGIEILPNRSIYYKSTDDKIITARGSDPFGATVIYNHYENGQGLMLFDSDVKKIGQEAFRSCRTLKEIQLPPSLTSIEYEAFCYCNGLTGSIYIPESVTSIGERAFMGCYNLSSFEGKFSSEDGRLLVDGSTAVAFAPYGLKSYVIPADITRLGNWLIYECNEIRSLTIPDNVTKIGDYAVYYCADLENIHIGTGVKSIGKELCWKCPKIRHAIIPENVTEVGSNIFGSCSLEYIRFKSSTSCIYSGSLPVSNDYYVYVPSGAYSTYCNNLPDYQKEKIVEYRNTMELCKTQPQNELWYFGMSTISTDYPDNIDATITGCSVSGGNGKLKFSNDITTIGKFVFDSNRIIRAVFIPNGVKTIGDYAFEDCLYLSTVVLPESIESIGNEAFNSASCTHLSLYCRATTPPTMGSKVLYKDNDGTYNHIIYVPENAVEAYKNADGWKEFADCITGYEF